MDTNEAFNQLKIMSKGNYEYAKAIMGIGDTIFALFDNQIQAQTVSPIIFKSIDANAFQKYEAITPVPLQKQERRSSYHFRRLS